MNVAPISHSSPVKLTIDDVTGYLYREAFVDDRLILIPEDFRGMFQIDLRQAEKAYEGRLPVLPYSPIGPD